MDMDQACCDQIRKIAVRMQNDLWTLQALVGTEAAMELVKLMKPLPEVRGAANFDPSSLALKIDKTAKNNSRDHTENALEQ